MQRSKVQYLHIKYTHILKEFSYIPWYPQENGFQDPPSPCGYQNLQCSSALYKKVQYFHITCTYSSTLNHVSVTCNT
jgi:hypothetical protein